MFSQLIQSLLLTLSGQGGGGGGDSLPIGNTVRSGGEGGYQSCHSHLKS